MIFNLFTAAVFTTCINIMSENVVAVIYCKSSLIESVTLHLRNIFSCEIVCLC